MREEDAEVSSATSVGRAFRTGSFVIRISSAGASGATERPEIIFIVYAFIMHAYLCLFL